MYASWLCFLGAVLPSLAAGRDIVFPPVAAIHPNGHGSYQSPVSQENDVLLEVEKYSGLTTFANLPWVHCLSAADPVEKYDIVFLGAPFDTATTARPGARFGPSGIRWCVIFPPFNHIFGVHTDSTV